MVRTPGVAIADSSAPGGVLRGLRATLLPPGCSGAGQRR